MRAAILAVLLGCTATLCAQNDSGTPTDSPGPQRSPAPNVNTGGNPTAPARLPAEASGDPRQPTFPSGDRRTWTRPKEGSRRNLEPSGHAHTSAPADETVSPGDSAPEPNPGALEGGPQP